MDSKQLLFIVAIIAALSAATIAMPIMAQMSDNASMGNLTGGNMTGKISGAEEDAECSKSPACIT